MNTNISDLESTPAALACTVSRRRRPAPPHATPTAPQTASSHLGVSASPPSVNTTAVGYTFRTWNRLHQRDRRIHFAVAITVSVAAHLALVWSGESGNKPATPAPQTATAVEIVAFEMPEPEETPIEVEDAAPAEAPAAEFAPPMQSDLPSIVTVDSFVQPMQPPVPTGISTDLNMMAVPTTITVGNGTTAPKLFEIAELDRVPNRIRTGLLNYPAEFRRSRKEGDVHLLVVIDPAGKVRVAKVLESTHPEFTRAAIQAAEQSLYESPRKGGVPVSAQYTLRVPFRLTPEG